eukprot:TRINITY_DN21472_c0_g1_i2.p1 TRINITY_DN21472_c0_g1~~TRINITY_DN21472_c0_g1_i2.p1  ORF type:complete len:399 (-),score=66.79 TRINITY_DN21472_c0_g1_i2:389-1585(-)
MGKHSGTGDSSRRAHQSRDDDAESDVFEGALMDLKEVLAKKGSDRQKWLQSALKAAKDEKVRPNLSALFDILTHKKFGEKVEKEAGRRMHRQILSHAELFSGKQQKYLQSKHWSLSQFATSRADDSDDDSNPSSDSSRGRSKSKSSERSESRSSSSDARKFGRAPSRRAEEDIERRADAKETSNSAFEEKRLEGSDPASTGALTSQGKTSSGQPAVRKTMTDTFPVSAPTHGGARTIGSKANPKAKAKAALAFAFGGFDDDDNEKSKKEEAQKVKQEIEAAARKKREAALKAPKSLYRATGWSAPPPDSVLPGAGKTSLHIATGADLLPKMWEASKSRSRSRSDGGFHGSKVVSMKRRAASNKNPKHDSLEEIKAQVLRERGIDPDNRKRSRSRERRR